MSGGWRLGPGESGYSTPMHPKESAFGGFQNLAECVGLGAMDALRVDAKQHDDAVSGPFCDVVRRRGW